jgi:hypothetical protein
MRLRKRREEEMNDENDWTRLAMSLDAIRETLLDGTRGVLAGSDSVTVLTDTWAQTVIELRKAQKQCAAYGEMHCPRVPDMPNAGLHLTSEAQHNKKGLTS